MQGSIPTEHAAALAHKTLEAFGERDQQARMKIIRETYAEDVTFADPDGIVVGWDALDSKIQRLQEEAPDFVFSVNGEVRVVQNLTHLSWHLGPAGAPPVVSGTDISLIENGRVKHLYTMLDAAPAAAPQP